MQTHTNRQNNLFLYRRKLGLTQRRVAYLLGHRDASMLAHYEHGRALPPLAVALTLEIVYRTPVAFLFPAMYDELRRRVRAQEEVLEQQNLGKSLTPPS